MHKIFLIILSAKFKSQKKKKKKTAKLQTSGLIRAHQSVYMENLFNC